MFPASNPPTIDSINAHYDHFRALPADENAAHRETILFTTADLRAARRAGRVIFTMGCHSALPGLRLRASATRLKTDWAQAYAQIGAVVYMGNTGYGLGDTAAVALLGEAERALRRAARRLDDGRPGACLRQAGVRGDADPRAATT